jgi:aminoglycoside phosphotransferase (APT) family kinase protein
VDVVILTLFEGVPHMLLVRRGEAPFLQAGNLLAAGGRLSGVIDFGCLGVGDPACDVAVAWMYLSSENRDAFRDALPVDDATWARGRGWGSPWA